MNLIILGLNFLRFLSSFLPEIKSLAALQRPGICNCLRTFSSDTSAQLMVDCINRVLLLIDVTLIVYTAMV